MSRGLTRLSAVFLTAIFLGSGFALPDLDALVFHSSGVADPGVPHVDLPGGCGTHAEHCALTLATPTSQLAPTIPAMRLVGVPPVRSVLLPISAPPVERAPLLHRSRAPPVAAS